MPNSLKEGIFKEMDKNLIIWISSRAAASSSFCFVDDICSGGRNLFGLKHPPPPQAQPQLAMAAEERSEEASVMEVERTAGSSV